MGTTGTSTIQQQQEVDGLISEAQVLGEALETLQEVCRVLHAQMGSKKVFPMKTVPKLAKDTLDGLTDDEKTQLLSYYMEEEAAGRIAFRRPGRPRKGSTAVSLHELLGITRQEACQWRKLANAAHTLGESGVKLGPREGAYTMLVKGGQRRPVDNMDTFDGTPLAQVAENLLAPAERLLRSGDLTKAMQKELVRALRSRLQRLALIWREPEAEEQERAS